MSFLRWFLGELPHFEREHSNTLIWWVGVISGLGILFGEYHLLSGNPMTRGLWRFGFHGAFSIAGLALFYAWFLESKSPSSKWWSVLSMVLLGVLLVVRVFGVDRGGPHFLRHHPGAFAGVIIASLIIRLS